MNDGHFHLLHLHPWDKSKPCRATIYDRGRRLTSNQRYRTVGTFIEALTGSRCAHSKAGFILIWPVSHLSKTKPRKRNEETKILFNFQVFISPSAFSIHPVRPSVRFGDKTSGFNSESAFPPMCFFCFTKRRATWNRKIHIVKTNGSRKGKKKKRRQRCSGFVS